MIMGSGVVGLGGMHPLGHFAHYPGLAIVRPLLDCSKVRCFTEMDLVVIRTPFPLPLLSHPHSPSHFLPHLLTHILSPSLLTSSLPHTDPPQSSLIQLCRDEGLEWIEDPSNQRPTSLRNKVRPVLAQHPELEAGLLDLMSLCRDVREITTPQVGEAMEQLASVNHKYGTLSFDVGAYQTLNPYVARGVMTVWLRYIGSKKIIGRYSLEKVHGMALGRTALPNTCSNCVLIPDPQKGQIMIAKQKPTRSELQNTRIRVGQTVLWDKRFKIRLFSTPSGRQRESSDKSDIFYIRNFHRDDHDYVKKGIRKVRSAVLVHYHVRGGLPVVMNSRGKTVFIPHFKVKNHCVGVDCEVEFSPPWTMRDLLNFPFINDT